MKKVQSLILLIESLSKSEKKAIILNSNLTKGDKRYMDLFRLIDKNKIISDEELQIEYNKQNPETTFHPMVNYLYDFILDILIKLKTNNNKEYSLYIDFLKAKILNERKLDKEYYNKLRDIDKKCTEQHNYHLLLNVKQMELEFFRENDYYLTNDKTIHDRIHDINEILKTLRQINEQSILYELLMHRILIESNTYYQINKRGLLDDLVISEISLNASLRNNVFEVQKTHLLFQAQYLIYVNDYNAALNTFIELDKLYTNNIQFWSNQPYVYIHILEGILASLKGIGKYGEMAYFIDKIEAVEVTSYTVNLEKMVICFIYKLSVLFYKKDYIGVLGLYNEYKSCLISKAQMLTPYRYSLLGIYLAILFIKCDQPEIARKQITHIINSKIYENLALFRFIQLINLVIHYELKDWNIITSRIRSIKRINKINSKESVLEDILFHFMEISPETLSKQRKSSLISKINIAFQEIKQYPIEAKAITLFDFKEWMISKL